MDIFGPGEVEEWKAKGDAAFRERDYDLAASMYTVAIDIAIHLAKPNATLFGNLSAAYYKLECHKFAVNAAQEAININPNWAKAHVRLALALCGLHNFTSALNAYQIAISLEPNNQEWKDGLQEVYKAMQAETHIGIVNFPEAELSGIFNATFMEKTWPANVWWYIPNSLDNPRHTFQEQWEHVAKIRAIGTSEPKKVPYSAMGFSSDINIMRGPSIMLHPTFTAKVKRAKDPFYAYCKLNGAVPDVLLWAPDISMHYMLTMLTDETGRHQYQGVTLFTTHENAQKGATMEKQKLKWTEELVQRAWKEAMRVEELHPLALILYPAMIIRYRNKRNEDKHFAVVRDFINICAKMKIDGLCGLLEARITHAALLEKRGTIEELKQAWKTISNFSGKARHKHEQRFFNIVKNDALTNLANILYEKERKYDEAWVIYQEAFKEAITFDFSKCVKDVMRGIFDIFLHDNWRTHEWRLNEATDFYKMARGYPSFPKEWNVPTRDNFWPQVLSNSKNPGENYVFLANPPKNVQPVSLADQLFTDKKATLNRMCAYCHKGTAKRLCSGCKTQYFCNHECQKLGWKTHKLVCKTGVGGVI